MNILLVVACALVDVDGRVLIGQRRQSGDFPGMWEFPGGKVEPGETPEAAIIREMDEELGVQINLPCLAPLTFASFSYENFHLLMPLFVCRKWQGMPELRDHGALKWVRPHALRNYSMPPADEPLIAHLCDLL